MFSSKIRKTVVIVGMSVLVLCMLCLSGCAITTKGKLKEATEDTMEKLKQMDTTVLGNKATSNQGVNGKLDGEKTMKYLSDCASKIKYEIKSVDTENLTVTVNCTYVDSSEIMRNAIRELLNSALSSAFSSNSAEFDYDFDTTFANEAAKVTEPLFVTKDIVIRFQKGENGYELTADNEDLYNVATSNILVVLDALKDVK